MLPGWLLCAALSGCSTAAPTPGALSSPPAASTQSAAAIPSFPDGFSYPIANPLIATIAGTPAVLQAQHAQPLRLKTKKLPEIQDRDIPAALWYGSRLEYSYAAQPGPAPLIFTIAGTGGYHDTGTNQLLMAAFFNAGYHVVGVTSPSHPEFAIAASATSVPGHMQNDAQDLYRIMKQIRDDLASKLTATNYALAGFSLGGTQAAFVAQIDAEQQAFNFRKVLLLNPSVSLYNSISKLDLMLSAIPGGIDNFNNFFAEIVERIGAVYTRSTQIEFDPDIVFQAFQAQPPSDDELAAIIGVAFRIAAANLIYTADVMTDYGFIKPSQLELSRNSRQNDYLQVALRVGFTDYFHDFFWPYYKDQFDGDREAFAHSHSLHAIEDFLKTANHIGVVHNEDDIILAPGEIDYVKEVFGSRAMIYPRGGHLGNLGLAQTQNDYINFLQQ